MTSTVSYKYAALSILLKRWESDELFLSKYSEIERKQADCFFWGRLT